MQPKIKYCPQEILVKQQLLHDAATILKNEFVGIDSVIDKVAHSITTWFLFPELQERPVIVNLWGMTGVGKTALVTRLATLLDYEKKFFRYDMGQNAQTHWSLTDDLKSIFRHNNGHPCMLVFDEFQYAKTKDCHEHEIDNHFSRVVWEVLDAGKFQSSKDIGSDTGKIIKWKNFIQNCLDAGIEVTEGIVTGNESTFLQLLDQMSESDTEYRIDIGYNHLQIIDGTSTYAILPKTLYSTMHTFLPEIKENYLVFIKYVAKLGLMELLSLFSKAIGNANNITCVDCSRTLIFILGNLDEAYSMCSACNPDISANEFHDASKLITINHIKGALKRRFRYEQISRLGNNHIIYPAFNEESFRKIINLELSRITIKTLDKFDITLQYTEAFKQLVYNEGVFPTQGARPVFSTIYQLINTKIPALISQTLLNNITADTILFDFITDHVKYEFSRDGVKLFESDEYIELSLAKLRKPSKDDLQAITAVHESGHAVITIKLMQSLPEYICSTSSDVYSRGFMVVKNKVSYLAKERILPSIAQLFGGIVAEQMIFGENKITSGAEEDIERATEIATSAIKDYGMGTLKACISIADRAEKYSYHDNHNDFNDEVRTILEHAYTLAERTLTEERSLLLHLADHLSDERQMLKNGIEKMVRLYGSQEIKHTTFIDDKSNLYYRKELKHQLHSLKNKAKESLAPEMHTSLNSLQ